MYDTNNIFAKILRQEVPCDIIKENQHAIAFNDIAKKANVHILVIPRGEYTDFSDFQANASESEKLSFYDLVNSIINDGNYTSGYRLITNKGSYGQQEVFHYHMHILSDG